MLPHEQTNSQAKRQSQRGRTNSRTPSRGGINKSRSRTPRVDRDGDLVMGTSAATRGANSNGRGDRHPRRGRGGFHNSKADKMNITLDPKMLQQAIARTANSNRPDRGQRNNPKPSYKGGHGHDTEGLDEVSIIGLKDSMAAKNSGGGISELVSWLEHKASKGAKGGDMVRIQKSRLEGAALIISVRPQDTPKITKLNDFTFAKAKLSIEHPSKSAMLESLVPSYDEEEKQRDQEKMKESTLEAFKAFLDRRYNAEYKLLDLSALAKDKELMKIGIFNSNTPNSKAIQSKFFLALMTVCDNHFTDAKTKEEAIVSVSLADNSLSNVSTVTTLAQTFPLIRNLDLSNNQIKDLHALEAWRWKFRRLNHLVVSGNPIETEVGFYQRDILKWYPSLTTINNDQVRSPEQIEAAIKGELPLPILPASFRDESCIAENFIKYFFPAWDTDRTTLVNAFYDAHTEFSLSVNPQAPGLPNDPARMAHGWGPYLKRSRNLTKLSQLPAKMHRLLSTPDVIREVFTTLPPTVHPDLMDERKKWCLECHTIPGVTDLTGQSKSGVGGMLIYVQGQFTEVDGYLGHTTCKRSFSRTFILAPGGPSGIRVASDFLQVRKYGSHDAWQPEELKKARELATYQVHIETPAGWAMPGFGKSEEQVVKERLILEMSQSTGLTLEASHECLQLVGWSPEGAMKSFQGAKADLPRHFFIATR